MYVAPHLSSHYVHDRNIEKLHPAVQSESQKKEQRTKSPSVSAFCPTFPLTCQLDKFSLQDTQRLSRPCTTNVRNTTETYREQEGTRGNEMKPNTTFQNRQDQQIRIFTYISFRPISISENRPFLPTDLPDEIGAF
jgi:hypothetical protein